MLHSMDEGSQSKQATSELRLGKIDETRAGYVITV